MAAYCQLLSTRLVARHQEPPRWEAAAPPSDCRARGEVKMAGQGGGQAGVSSPALLVLLGVSHIAVPEEQAGEGAA